MKFIFLGDFLYVYLWKESFDQTCKLSTYVIRSCFSFPIGRQVRYCPMGEVGGGGQRLWSRQRLEADGQSELSPAETARELQTHSDSDLNTLDQILNQPNHLRKESNTPSEETWPTHAGGSKNCPTDSTSQVRHYWYRLHLLILVSIGIMPSNDSWEIDELF